MPSLKIRDNTSRPYTTSETRTCQYCLRELNAKGHGNHERVCKIRTENQDFIARRELEHRLQIAVDSVNQEARNSNVNNGSELAGLDIDESDGRDSDVHENETQARDLPDRNPQSGSSLTSHSISSRGTEIANNTSSAHGNAVQTTSISRTVSEDHQPAEGPGLEVDDIKVEYHPRSGKQPVVYHFQDYQRRKSSHNIPLDEEPWKPFVCRADFDFARVAMEAALKPEHINSLIKLIKNVMLGTAFTLSGERELSKIWKLAANKLTPFKKEEIEVPYKRVPRKYTVWFRPLWDWTIDILKDSRVAPLIVWDAERLYKFNGSSFVRFYDEPWSGNRFWNIQDTLAEGKPFCWIIHADKNKLSSFGTEQGYPVIARCANLPTDIRNGDGLGGGRVIGWLPIVKDPSVNKKKVSWTNHKRAVWHAAMRKIFESIASISESGHWFECSDGITRKIHPCIPILSADYEEQTFMTLIRGVTSLFPCPRCLIPHDAQADLSVSAQLRTQADTENLFQSLSTVNKGVLNDTLKKNGLRNIKNTFWEIKNSDPYESSSWDRLHSYSTGIFGSHMWSNFKLLFDEIGRSAEDQIDRQFDLMPRFKGLHHFAEAIPIAFNDGSKFESLAKQLLFVAHNVLTPQRSRHGYILLQCLRVFLILDMYLSLEVHTEDTIEAGRKRLPQFSKLIAAYVNAIPSGTSKDFTVNWDFVKMHLQKHAFDDIRAKGVTRNYNTKPNEKLHKPLRDAYHLRTNFKDVANQILRADHYLLVSALIKSKLKELDDHLAQEDAEPMEQDSEASPNLNAQCHYTIGSGKEKNYICAFEELNVGDLAFKDFWKLLANHFNEFFLAHSIPLPNGRPIQIKPYDEIRTYKVLKINYESMVTWRQETDILRCNPNFHKHPRFDSIIFRTANNGFLFGRLICITGFIIGGEEYHTALIQPCDVRTGRSRRKDIDLDFVRVKAKPRSVPEIISVHTIVRGAVLVPDFDKQNEFIVMDVLDRDMYLRVQEIRRVAAALSNS